MTKMLFSAHVVPQPSARRELLQALLGWAGSVREGPGLVGASVYEDVENPAAFHVETEWTNASALEDHLRSGSFGALLGGFELLAQPARLVVTTMTEPYGADPLTAIRKLREGRPRAEPESKPGARGEGRMSRGED